MLHKSKVLIAALIKKLEPEMKHITLTYIMLTQGHEDNLSLKYKHKNKSTISHLEIHTHSQQKHTQVHPVPPVTHTSLS